MKYLPEETATFPPKKKNTKKWCKGKKGVEHQYEWRGLADFRSFMIDWKVEVCTKCGKQGKWERPEGRFPWLSSRNQKDSTST